MKRLFLACALSVGSAALALREAPGNHVTRLSPTNLRTLNTAKDEDDPHPYFSEGGKTRRLFYTSNASGHLNVLVSEPDRRGSPQSAEQE